MNVLEAQVSIRKFAQLSQSKDFIFAIELNQRLNINWYALPIRLIVCVTPIDSRKYIITL